MTTTNASLRFVSQKLISPTAQYDIQNVLASLTSPNSLTGTSNSFLQPFISTRSLGSYNFVGNVNSGQQTLAQYGYSKPDGTIFNKDTTLIPLSSAGQIISSVVVQKAIEMGLLSTNESMSSYLPTLFMFL